MFRFFSALIILALLPISASAVSTSSIENSSCSGDLTSSLLDGATFLCSGNFTMSGGFITSDSLINISANGDLLLDNLTITAPSISFSVLTGMLRMGSNVILSASSVVLARDVIDIRPGTYINIDSGVKGSKGNGGDSLGTVADASISVGGNLSLKAGIRDVLQITGIDVPVVGGTLVLDVNSSDLILLDVSLPMDVSLSTDIRIASVPEPTTYAMLLAGMLALVLFRRRAT